MLNVYQGEGSPSSIGDFQTKITQESVNLTWERRRLGARGLKLLFKIWAL